MNIQIRFIHRYAKYIRLLRGVLFRKPLLILRIISNYFRIFVLKQRIVRKVEMGVTFKCQCNCAKCSSVFMEDPAKDKLTIKEIEKVANDIINLGAIHINLTGGEPLLEKDIFEIIKCFNPNKTLITINTNGVLLNEDLIDRLEKAGVDIIKISIDSPIEEEHDESRGYKGCFRKAMESLDYIKRKKGILGQISTVCIKENLNSDRIWKLVDMAKEYDVLLGLTIPAASGKWVNSQSILIGEKEREALRKLIRVPHVIRDTDEAYLRRNCPAGSEEFYLTCYGDIIPCPLIQISFGNVKNENVKRIWERMSCFEEFKNKKVRGCLAGESQEFICRYLEPLKNVKKLPIKIEDHPASKKI